MPLVGLSSGGTALSPLSGAEQWWHSPVTPRWGRAGLSPPQRGRAWVWQVPPVPGQAMVPPHLGKVQKSPQWGSGRCTAMGGPITAPTLGPGPAVPLPGHPKVGWGPVGASTFFFTPFFPPHSGRRRGAHPLAGRRLPLQQRRCPPGHPQVGCVPQLSCLPPCHPHAGSTLLAWEMPVALFHAHIEPSPCDVCRERKINEGVDNGFNVFKVFNGC